MPEYVLDSRGRRRSVLLSVKECAEITERIDHLRRELDVTEFPASPEEEAMAHIEQRVQAAATARVPVPAGSRAGVPAGERAEPCGARVVSRKGKTVACLLTMREFNLLIDQLEDLEDSLELKVAMEGPPEERIPLDEVLSRYGLAH